MPALREPSELLVLRRKPRFSGWIGLGWRAAIMAGLVWVLVDHDFVPREHLWIAGVTWAVAVFVGVTMVSNVPFWSFKEVNWKKRVPLWVILAAVVALSVVASRPSLVLFALVMGYAASGYIMWGMGHRARPVLPEE